jgi:hypothetical protein
MPKKLQRQQPQHYYYYYYYSYSTIATLTTPSRHQTAIAIVNNTIQYKCHDTPING